MPYVPSGTDAGMSAAFGAPAYKPKPEAGAFGALMAASAKAAPTLKKPKNAAAIKAAQQQAIQAVQARQAAQAPVGITPLAEPGLSAAFAPETNTAFEQEAQRQAAAAEAKRLATPIYRQSGSGRQAESRGTVGSPTSLATPPAVFVPPEAITAPPAVTQPPAVVAEAPPSEVNVPGESFTTVGSPGSFGAYERRRTARGPSTGLSVTPEMIRRAASQRLG